MTSEIIDQEIKLSFSYDSKIVDAIKTNIDKEYRRFCWDTKSWFIDISLEDQVAKLVKEFSNIDEKVMIHLTTSLGESDNPVLPTHWNHIKKQYAATITFDDDYNLVRDFLGSRENFSSTRKNADIEYKDEVLEKMPIGTVLEIKEGSYKHMPTTYHRKTKNGWVLVATRKGTSNWYGGGKDSLSSILG